MSGITIDDIDGWLPGSLLVMWQPDADGKPGRSLILQSAGAMVAEHDNAGAFLDDLLLDFYPEDGPRLKVWDGHVRDVDNTATGGDYDVFYRGEWRNAGPMEAMFFAAGVPLADFQGAKADLSATQQPKETP